ncbi:hypothetical protein Pmar_PMAR019969 [Perkinsus marinus ATCC 50983]|uniref:Uncharacterized protein n=1 Tax=Perkinsus marinus (strain ATCC 50983 / TXsc) TaxID=423536 RepID=C5LJ76_PERM5|nr:hypothetical protein Pmar_PMAR019969 [Perkinsus marinus ATCC 50983]EER03192.1 hypothetical protein Pmar_PMAR019969 [Perkinsus marinus ATCC 50983]|eukprot:XP_002771376.1 hypothetical protein Pmar_PMAR019969 [Perkinsus marinus ATCC 50983]
MSVTQLAVDRWWSTHRPEIPDHLKEHLHNYYITRSSAGKTVEESAWEWLETINRVHFDRGDTAPSNGEIGYDVPRRIDREWIEELPIERGINVDSRRSSIAKDPGRVFDDILGTSKDLKITPNGNIRADASGSVRLLSRLCETMGINLRTTKFGKNWLKHGVVFCHYQMGMGEIPKESLKGRWTIWYDSVKSVNMDTDPPPPPPGP